MSIIKYEKNEPQIDKSVFIAHNATVIGNVFIKENSSIWFNSVIRADADKIFIGQCTNIQDMTVCHVDPGCPIKIGDYVTVGHRCVIHGCNIDNNCLIGMGAIIMNNAKIGECSIIAAGSVVKEDSVIPPYSLVTGIPGKIKKQLEKDVLQYIKRFAMEYIKRADKYKLISV